MDSESVTSLVGYTVWCCMLFFVCLCVSDCEVVISIYCTQRYVVTVQSKWTNHLTVFCYISLTLPLKSPIIVCQSWYVFAAFHDSHYHKICQVMSTVVGLYSYLWILFISAGVALLFLTEPLIVLREVKATPFLFLLPHEKKLFSRFW